MLYTIWKDIRDDNVFSSASSYVSHCDSVVNWISWANFRRAAFFANEHRFSAKQRAESYRSGFYAEACANIAFSFTFKPNSSWDGLTFANASNRPCEYFAIYMSFRLASHVSDPFWESSSQNNFANIAASRNFNIERILITEHTHFGVFSTNGYSVAGAFARRTKFARL